MKNFKKVLAVVLAVLFVVPAMAFSASADAELANWTVAAANNSSNVSADMENDLAIVEANEDGSISAWDASTALGMSVNDTALTKITSTAPNYLDGMELTIAPVGSDVDGDGEVEYASHYAICFTDHPGLYDGTQQDSNAGDGYSLGHYVYPAGQDKENSLFVVLNDEIPIVGAPANGEAEYVTYAVISNGNFWTIKFVKFDEPVKFSEDIHIEVINAFDDEMGAFDLALMINDQYAAVPDCSDAYEGEVGTSPVFYTSVAAYAHGQNLNTASFDLTSICNSADVVGYTGIYCAADAHAWSDWSEATEPTCTEDGITTRTCANCPKVETEVVAVATGHAYAETVVPATCEAAGSKTNTCANCGDVVVEAIAALGHNYTVKHWITLPTADAAGTARLSCAACGDIQAELASIEAAADVYWTASGTASDMIVNEDGSLTFVETEGVDNITVATANFAYPLDGYDVTIAPVGEGKTPWSYSFFYTSVPGRYTGSAGYCKGCAHPYMQGLYNYGDTDKSNKETTMGIVLNDYIGHWHPDYSAEANGLAEFICFVTINEGNYWCCDMIRLDTPVDLSKELKVEAFCYFDEEMGALTAGALLNEGTNDEQWTFATCPEAFEPLNAGCNLVVASGDNGVPGAYTTSFTISSVADSTDVANFAGSGKVAVAAPVVSAKKDVVTVSNAAYVNDIIIISGEGYTGYADIKAAKATADFYYRATFERLEGYTYTKTLVPGTYTVLTRTIDGAEQLTVVNTEAWGKAVPNSQGRVKFEATKEIRVIRFAPVAGLDTVAEIKAAEGYTAIKESAFLKYDAESENMADNGVETLRLFPGVGEYSYVIEYVDGTKEFGEFVIDGAWDDEGKAPKFEATGITNMVQNRFIKAYYAAGTYNSVKEIKAAEGYRVILKDYTVRDTEEVVDETTGEVSTKNLDTRSYTFKKALSGEYTFAIVWGNAAAPATIYHVTF